MGVFKSGAGAAHSARYSGNGFILPYHALLKPCFHIHQALAFFLSQLAYRNACPHRNDFGNVLSLHQQSFILLLDAAEPVHLFFPHLLLCVELAHLGKNTFCHQPGALDAKVLQALKQHAQTPRGGRFVHAHS
ncbi:MAG: hypothetical protein BWY63_03549 [Chloroflexi bacterium ADurb.Bin360]|nr:MAG: hypothetical protein BWY63_03549 [Chloroflexi bacterium ADurb.Bin360]